jgi:S-DNA-T family DNA segregation ATPase FtsK/SpoIIIE
LATNLKYEVIGILFMIFSIVSLAGKTGSEEIAGMGSVGHALNYIFYFLVGRLHFIFPLIGIYIGLYVMMRRAWPRGWSYRKTGMLLIVFGFLIYLHISLYNRLYAGAEHGFFQMLGQPMRNLTDLLGKEIGPAAFFQALGGGFVGALLYAVLHTLFDDLGAKLVMWSLFVIGFVCVTGWTISDMLYRLSGGLTRNGAAFRQRMRDLLHLVRQRRQFAKAMRGADVSAATVRLPIEDELDEEHLPPAKRPRRQLKWFNLFSEKPKPADEPDDQADDLAQQAETEADQGVFIGPEPAYAQEEEARPRIRDFLDHPEAGYPAQDDDAGEEAAVVRAGIADAAHAEDDAIRADGSAAVHTAAASPGQVGGAEAGAAPSDETPAATEPSKEPEKAPAPYRLPPLSLLSRGSASARSADQDHMANARKLEATLESFGVRAKVVEVVRGPAVTRYEIQPDIGVKVSRIVNLTDDIALALAAKDIRMEAPIPGKSAIGIEVPNAEVSVVRMREVMESAAFAESDAKLTIALGRDISGQPIVANLAKMPHLLVAGATGSGKSVCINGIIVSILYKARPDEVKFLMVDPKMVELNGYNGIPHLLAPVVTDPRRASLALKQVVREMEKRYELFSKSGTRNIESYNQHVQNTGKGERLPFIVVIVDELADLMMVAAGDVEDSITRLAQMARAAGIHLILATQRPSVDVITGVIKANIPSRIAFGVSSQVDSRTILDTAGAEKLLGRGDMLFVPVGANKAIRIQGAFLSDEEVEAVVNFVRSQGSAEYREEMVPEVEESAAAEEEEEDELFEQAAQIVLEAGQASVSLLQRRMRIGYTRAARLIDYMEAKGIVGPYEGSKPREVLTTLEQFMQSRMSS